MHGFIYAITKGKTTDSQKKGYEQTRSDLSEIGAARETKRTRAVSSDTNEEELVSVCSIDKS